VSNIPPKTLVQRGAFRKWCDERAGIDSVLEVMLNEPIPGGARWAYVFGSGLLFLFVSQILTGIALALYYVPAENDAHVTVAYIVKVVSGGSFLRSMHSYGASAIIVVLLLHIIQTFFYGAYKGRRELVWIAGCALFALMLGMAFTGYLLPWDQKAYFATAVGTNVMDEVPVIGNFLKRFLRGGNQMGTITISRFFVLHVFVLPVLIATLAVIHVYLFRKVGPAGPVSEDPIEPRQPVEMFYPRQFAKDFIFAILLAAAIAGLSYWYPVQLGPEANPADAAFLPRPEWYFLPVFQWLKLWPGQSAIIGVVVLPAIVTSLFVGLPFIDRSLERHPLRRPVAVGTFCLVLGGLISFGVLSRIQDRRDSAVVSQMARQERAMRAFMDAPFSPLTSAADVRPAAPAPTPVAVAGATPPVVAPAADQSTADAKAGATPAPSKAGAAAPGPSPAGSAAPELVAQGRARFNANKCFDCHGKNGEGTEDGPDLTMTKLTPAQIVAFLQKPSSEARLAGMPEIPATSAEFQPLVAYVLSLKKAP
jgi:ubiquinol-cytochrome c reductase cytochrome b subunit